MSLVVSLGRPTFGDSGKDGIFVVSLAGFPAGCCRVVCFWSV